MLRGRRREEEGGEEGGMNEDVEREAQPLLQNVSYSPTWTYGATGRWLLSRSFSKHNAVITL